MGRRGPASMRAKATAPPAPARRAIRPPAFPSLASTVLLSLGEESTMEWARRASAIVGGAGSLTPCPGRETVCRAAAPCVADAALHSTPNPEASIHAQTHPRGRGPAAPALRDQAGPGAAGRACLDHQLAAAHLGRGQVPLSDPRRA